MKLSLVLVLLVILVILLVCLVKIVIDITSVNNDFSYLFMKSRHINTMSLSNCICVSKEVGLLLKNNNEEL